MLVVADLAEAIRIAIDAKDKDGNSIAGTSEMTGYAQAVINTLLVAPINHAIPGDVTGDTTAGAPLQNGAATNGIVGPLSSGVWQSALSSSFPTANPANLSVDANGSTGYISSAATSEFAAGTITGSSTATPLSPGILAAGAGANGTIEGLSGAAWAAAVMPPGADPVLTQKIYDAISDYVEANAECEYLVGSVTGTTPAASGPLQAGVALLGTIS
jgi:hypothetical protein